MLIAWCVWLSVSYLSWVRLWDSTSELVTSCECTSVDIHWLRYTDTFTNS